MDDGGNLCVADMLNGRVQVFNSQHQFVRAVGQPGDRYGDLGQPKKLSVGPDGTLFIADIGFAHVHLFNGQGQLLMLLGDPDATPMPAGLTIARTVPPHLAAWVPADFRADYYLFVANTVGPARLSLYAIGTGKPQLAEGR